MRRLLIAGFMMLSFSMPSSAEPAQGALPQDASKAFQPATQAFRLVTTGDYASCFTYKVVDSRGQTLALPEALADALDCPFVASVRGNVLTINAGLEIRQFDLQFKKERTLFSVYKDNEGVSGPVYSPDGRRLAFVVIDQLKRHGQKDLGRIIVVDTQSSPPALKKFDRSLHFVCGSSCFAVEGRDFGFKDSNTIFFRKHEMGPDPGQEVEIAL